MMRQKESEQAFLQSLLRNNTGTLAESSKAW
jgi:hypothetical protein